MAGILQGIRKKYGEDSGTVKFFTKVYRFVQWVKKSLMNFYVGILEFLLPRRFYLQSKPQSVIDAFYPDFNRDARKFNGASKISIRDGNRLLMIKFILDRVQKLQQGEYAELGTFRGKMARIIYKFKAKDSKFYCFDTFEGFVQQDVKEEKLAVNLDVTLGNFSNTSLPLVYKNILGKETQVDDLKLVQGYFPETFSGFESHKWRFVHLDMDLYLPMKNAVELFWPNMVPGGILLVHDYNGPYTGTKKAMDEYFDPLGIQGIPMIDKVGSIMYIKE